MNALPLPLQQAMRGWMPPAETDPVAELSAKVVQLRAQLKTANDRYESLLRLPFEFEVMTQPATVNLAPENCSEAEYGMREADEAVVHAAVDWLIEKHMDELTAKVEKLQKVADLEGME